MKLNVSKINKDKIENLLLIKEMNIAAANSFLEFSFYQEKERSDEVIHVIEEFLDLNKKDPEDVLFLSRHIVPCIKELAIDDYLTDYYYQNIKPAEKKVNGYSLEYLTINPYQIFPYNDIAIKDDYVEVSSIGYFNKEYKYLAILKNNTVWMSLDPNEMVTMKEEINSAKGNVLAFGLGLGYFPLSVAHKKEVSSVTIVEKDPEIIKLFKENILPLSSDKNKIIIIKDDAYKFIDKTKLEGFDYIYADIWHNAEDGLPLYLKFKKHLKGIHKEVHYWLEESILAMYRRCLLTIIEETLIGATDSNYKKAKNDYDHIINDLYFKTKDISINSYNELIDLLSAKSLLKIINK